MNGWIEFVSVFLRNSHLAAQFLDAAIKSFLLLTLAAGAILCCRRAAAAARHLVWLLTLVSLPFVPLLSWTLPSWEPAPWKIKESPNRVQVGGRTATMKINALLAKVIFDKDPGREFYVEESLPFDWMYPHLEPHGLILKLDRQPLATLPTQVVNDDHAYWRKLVDSMVGGDFSEQEAETLATRINEAVVNPK